MKETLEHVTEGLGQQLSEKLARFPTLRLDNMHKDGAPVYVAPLLYSGRIFISWLKLDPNGVVTMLEDNPLDFGEYEALRLAVAEHLVEIGGDTTGKSNV